jgi:2-deoxy-D-gluconate 3-dehydrogenase
VNLAERFSLDGQAAIVTGASSGLGRIMALGLSKAGCQLIVTARRAADLDETVDMIAEHGGYAVAVPADLRTRSHGEVLVERASKKFGRLDGVVLNAGMSTAAPAEEEDLEAFAEVMEVNVTAQVALASAAAKAMIPAGGGWMIAMSSILGVRAGTGAGVAAYTASKGAVEQLVRELGRQWAPKGIRVNGLAPGYFPTAMNAPITNDPDRRASIMGRIPLGRAGEPEDLETVTVFLASDAARYLVGTMIPVDGGMTCS